MFVVLLTYKKPLNIVEHYLTEHRLFLDRGYQQQLLMVSGPRTPRTGGVILSQCMNRTVLETFLTQDPFFIHDIATYELIEFTPVKFHQALRCLVMSD